jgi:dethiobiotin synthetase
MRRGLFVTGTDTNVGKTVVSAALFHRYRPEVSLCYWKPVQTGIEQDDDTATVRALGECADGEIFDQGVRLPRPVSPHLAARWAGRRITVAALLALWESAPVPVRWIVEGAGGVLVPLNEGELMVDLMRALHLPALIVARSTLGTINHTLLTVEALRHRAIPIAGVVMVGPPNPENRRAIEEYGGVPVLGEMPWFEPLTPEGLRTWAQAGLDPDGRLREVWA